MWFSKKQNTPLKAPLLEKVEQALMQVQWQHTGLPILSDIQNITLQQDIVDIDITVNQRQQEELNLIHQKAQAQLHVLGINEVNFNVTTVKSVQKDIVKINTPVNNNKDDVKLTPAASSVPKQEQLLAHPTIKNIVLVASGKGGVGKSTTAVNLALALQKLGNKVGMLDADIYGPSIPAMLNVAGQTPLIENSKFVPINAYNMPIISIACLTGDDKTPIVWRGAKATGALMQLYNDTLWPQLDFLIIDMPPGTGDIQLTLAQRIPVTGAVVVTTPQHIALLDAQKGIEMFNKVNIPILGIVENMSLHVCSQCGHEEEIFGTGGGALLEQQYHVPLLGKLPLNGEIRKNTDLGKPSVVADDVAAPHYIQIAQNLINQANKIPKRGVSNRIM